VSALCLGSHVALMTGFGVNHVRFLKDESILN
jgi:hypothetical protein